MAKSIENAISNFGNKVEFPRVKSFSLNILKINGEIQMSDVFKFEKYAYEPDPDFDDLEFIKFENLKNQVITITDNIRISDDKSSVKMEIIMNDAHYCTFTKAKAIVRTLSNIMDDIGTIPNIPVMIGTYSTNNGKDGYCFKDVTE